MSEEYKIAWECLRKMAPWEYLKKRWHLIVYGDATAGLPEEGGVGVPEEYIVSEGSKMAPWGRGKQDGVPP